MRFDTIYKVNPLMNDVMFDADFNRKWGDWHIVPSYYPRRTIGGVKKDSRLREICTIEQAIRLSEAQSG